MADFDQSPQLLGVASDATARAQQMQAEKAKMNQEVVQNAGAPAQQAATTGLSNMAEQATNKITITPEMSEGLSKMTGDEGWKKATGTQWDPRIFTAMVGVQSKQQMRDQLEQFKQGSQSEKEAAEAQRQADRETDQTQREHDRESTQEAIAEMRRSSKGGEATPIKASLLRKFYGPGSVPKEVGDDENVPPLLVKSIISQKDDVAAFVKLLNMQKNPLTGMPPDAVEKAMQAYQQMKQAQSSQPQSDSGASTEQNNDPLGLNK
jgi:hypothetical protein